MMNLINDVNDDEMEMIKKGDKDEEDDEIFILMFSIIF